MKDAIKVLLICYIVILILSEFVYSNIRFAFYLLPVLTVLVSIIANKFRVNIFTKNILLLGLIPVLSIIPALIFNFENSDYIYRYLKESIFIVSVLVMCAFISDSIRPKLFLRYLTFFVIALLIIFLASEFQNLSSLFRNIVGFLLYSQSDTESTFASVYGAICIYFFVKKKRWAFLIAFLLVIIGSKRIVLGGVVGSIIIGYLIDNFNFKHKTVLAISLLINVLLVSILINVSSGIYDTLINSNLGVSSNQLLMGRITLYNLVLSNFDGLSFLGAGLGSTSVYIEQNLNIIGRSELLHSDILKLYIELGVVLSLWYFITLIKFYKISRKTIYIIIYINILYITGNTLIYVHVNIIIYLILTALCFDNEDNRRITS